MIKLFVRATFVVTVCVAAQGCNSRPARHDDFNARQVLSYLASDELEGRGLGSAGLDRAATVIAEQFRKIGVRPAPGQKDYFQNFEITTATDAGPETSFVVGAREFDAGNDFTPLGFSPDGEFAGSVVFVGYGMKNAAHVYDDYAGVDVKGKVALAMRYEPHTAKGKSRFADDNWSSDAALSAKARAARDAGAAALLIVNPVHFHDDEKLIPPGRDRGEPILPTLHIKRGVAEHLLRSGKAPDLKALQEKIDKSGKPSSLALEEATARGNIELVRTRVPVKNVVGFVPGVQRNEYVVVGAHYDHLGRGNTGAHGRIASTRRSDDDIYNGADDNASGTAAMLTLASRIARGPTPPRSILFIAFTGEEEGLLGSEKFVQQPPIPLSQIVAMLNLDMVGRIRTTSSGGVHPSTTQSATTTATTPSMTQNAGAGILYVGGSGTAESFENIIRRADDASPLVTRDIGKGGIGPSDHTSFALKRIPVLFFFSGLHGDYHRPTDDADKINYAGIDAVVDFVADVVRQVAAMPKEKYVEAADASPTRIGSGSGSNVTLGVVPDYGSFDTGGGVRISGTTPGSPAAAAGLQAGDVLTKFGERKLETLYDLSDCLAKAKVGQKIKLKIIRNEQPMELEATLAERKG